MEGAREVEVNQNLDLLVRVRSPADNYFRNWTDAVGSGGPRGGGLDLTCANPDFVGSTKIESEPFSFLWTLRNYSKLSDLDEITSVLFYGDSKNNHAWQLKVTPKKRFQLFFGSRFQPQFEEYFGVHLILKEFGTGENSDSQKIRVRYQIALLQPDGQITKSCGNRSMEAVEFKKSTLWGCDKFLTLAELNSPNLRLLVNDELRIHCSIWIEGEITHSSITKGLPSAEERALKNKRGLVEDLGKFFRNSVNTDFEILVDTPDDDGIDILRVHRCILAARSPYMAARFEDGLHEDNQMTITFFNRTVVDAMLEYLYTGSVDPSILDEFSPDILQIAEMFQVPELKNMCAAIVSNHIEVQNASTLLILAHLYNADVLKARAMAFINRNKEEVMNTAGFQEALRHHRGTGMFADLYVAEGLEMDFLLH